MLHACESSVAVQNKASDKQYKIVRSRTRTMSVGNISLRGELHTVMSVMLSDTGVFGVSTAYPVTECDRQQKERESCQQEQEQQQQQEECYNIQQDTF